MKQAISWECLRFDDLTGRQVHAILKARCEVFIVEQNCPFPDVDNRDQTALHLMAWTEDNQLAAYLRIHPPHSAFQEPALGRVLTTAAFRGTGTGRQLIERGLQLIQAHHPDLPVRIGAQSYLIPFYASFGFETASEEYIEDGIPHTEMLKK